MTLIIKMIWYFIGIDYQAQRPPCRQKDPNLATNLNDIGLISSKKNMLSSPAPMRDKNERKMLFTDMNSIVRPPSRHKEPSKGWVLV